MEKQFVDGLIFKLPSEKSPDFVRGRLSIKTVEFIKYLQEHDNNGWVNVDLKVSQNGKPYTELNTWKPENKSEEEVPLEDIFNQ